MNLLDNPFILITLLCLCFPGLLPMVGAFLLARNFNFRIEKRNQGGEL